MKRFSRIYRFCFLCGGFVLLLCLAGQSAVTRPIAISVTDTPPVLFDRAAPRVPEVLDLQPEFGVVLYSSPRWRLARRTPSGYLDVYRCKESSKCRRLDLTLEWRRNTYPMLAIESGAALFLVSYDTVANLPSGRRAGVVREGYDLYAFSGQTGGEPDRIAENLKLGGIDDLLYASVSGEPADRIDLCGANRCLTVGIPDRRVASWKTDGLARYDIVELAFHGQSAIALIRKKTNEQVELSSPIPQHPFQIAFLTPEGVETQPLPTERGIPWGLEWQGDSAVLRIAESTSDLADMLRYDLGRMAFSGVMEFGANNLEGRIAWSQVYYLQGLISLLRAHPAADSAMREAVRRRLAAEMDHMQRLVGTGYPGLASKRYSVDREPVIFALHLGRVLHLLENWRAVSGVAGMQEGIIKMMLALDETVEVLVSRDLGETSTLAYRYGAPFWADGVNVPINYISGYISGLLAVGCPLCVERSRQLARAMMSVEFGDKLPTVWRYWTGIGDTGWQETDTISLNTPVFQGNLGAPAHISYRSMDAIALSHLYRSDRNAVSGRLIDHFADLAARGWLLPFVNEELRIGGRARPLEPEVARYYARSAAAWELQSQIAALRWLPYPP